MPSGHVKVMLEPVSGQLQIPYDSGPLVNASQEQSDRFNKARSAGLT